MDDGSDVAPHDGNSYTRNVTLRAVCWRAGVRLWRAAVLAAVQRQLPHDAEALAIAQHHFGCTRDIAAGLHARAQARYMQLSRVE